jgi:predicted nucleic acid-binding protein
VKRLQNPAVLLLAQQRRVLGSGEISTILQSKELAADLVLLDDYKARKLVREEGLQILRSAGLLTD